MAEDKAFEPTPARLARAKRDGDVARSRDIGAVASFVAAFGALVAVGDGGAAAARSALSDALRGHVAAGPYALLAVDASAIVASAAGGGVLASLVQTGGIAFRFPTVKLAKLAPTAGLRRMVGRDAALGAGKAVFVAFAVGLAAVLGARDAVAGANAPTTTTALARIAQSALASAVSCATLVATTFAIADVLLERASWRRRLKMSFEEIKREHKSSEGSPELRGRRRAAHRNLARGSIASVKDAAFVVTNPTHVAVALEYRPPAVAVPRVLVRATDDGAQAVKARARSLGIPVVEDVVLARALLASTVVGEPIPRDTYGAVAVIVATLARAAAVS
jgi:flagellar biosynthesis protein FlhB